MQFRKVISVFLMLAIFAVAFGQGEEKSGYSSTSKALQKLRWDMNLGTSFTFMPGYGGGMNYYAAPGFYYPINKRFSFHGGMLAGVFTTPGLGHAEQGQQKVTSGYTSIYGTAAYHLNQNVVFYASGVKSIHTYGKMNPFIEPSFDEISFGSSIRLGENVTIGASVHFREYSPMSGGYYSPFFH